MTNGEYLGSKSLTIYNQTTSNTYSNYNDGSNYWYAFEFTPTVSGAISEITLNLETGSSGTGDSLYIRDQKSATSANYGYATGIAWSAGAQTIQLTPGSQVTAGNTYYVCVKVTNSAAHPKFQYDTTKTNFGQWRSASADGDPTTFVRTYDLKMSINYKGSTKLLLHLNGNSTDSSGNGNNGTDTNITYVDGKLGQGASFNSSHSSLISFTNVSADTISFWFNPVAMYSGATGYALFSDSGMSTIINGQANTGKIEIYDGSSHVGNNTWVTGVWSNYVFVYDTNGYNVYLNGQFLEKITCSKLNIGKIGRTSPSNLSPEMKFDELIIENRAWSAEEIKKYYTYARGQFALN